jgi:hypothetical protein
MTKSLLDAIAKSPDRKWLSGCRAHNLKLGNKEVVAAIDQRLRDLNLDEALRRRADANSIEERVKESVRVYRELLRHKHGRGQAAGYTEREIRDYGERDALIRTIRRGKKTEGLKLLAQHDRLDCAYEQIALDHADELPNDVVEQARQTLADFTASRT